jgi:phage shock protein A
MKFKTKLDEVQYQILNLNEVEVRKRLGAVKKKISKDRDKERTMRDQWRRNKHKMMKGIKKWNKSTAGKRFHRALGRFNALRENATMQYVYDELSPGENSVEISIDQVNDALLSLSSIETHLYIELQYYEPNPEVMTEFLLLVYNFVDYSSPLKKDLLDAYTTGKILKSQYDLLVEIIQTFQDPKAYLYVKRELQGLENDLNNDSELQEQLKKVKQMQESVDDVKEMYKQIDEMLEAACVK